MFERKKTKDVDHAKRFGTTDGMDKIKETQEVATQVLRKVIKSKDFTDLLEEIRKNHQTLVQKLFKFLTVNLSKCSYFILLRKTNHTFGRRYDLFLRTDGEKKIPSFPVNEINPSAKRGQKDE